MTFRPVAILLCFVFLAALAFSGQGCAEPSGARYKHAKGSMEKTLPGLVDLQGQAVNPFGKDEPAWVTFIFVRHDCPISNRYAPLLSRLQSRFSARGVRFWLVHADPDVSVDAIRAHREEYGLDFSVLRDTRHALVKFSKATVTPEAMVFASGKPVYRGRIDDRYVDFGKERPAAGQHDLEEALTSVLEGRPVKVAVTRAVGCYIPPLR